MRLSEDNLNRGCYFLLWESNQRIFATAVAGVTFRERKVTKRIFSFYVSQGISLLRKRVSFDPPQKKPKTLHSWREKFPRNFSFSAVVASSWNQTKVLSRIKLKLSNQLFFSVDGFFTTTIQPSNVPTAMGCSASIILCTNFTKVLGIVKNNLYAGFCHF